jgi:hypothetical protein
MLFSRMLTSLNFKRRNNSIDITAAGMEAETVIPIYNPRYVFAAVINAPSINPRMMALKVSSGSDEFADT